MILLKLYNKLFILNFYRIFLAKAGVNFRTGYNTTIFPLSSFEIGNNFYCGPYCYLSSNKTTLIKIGHDVMFGPYCKLIGGNHNINWTGGRMYYAPQNKLDKGIIIEDDVWLGMNVTVLDGAKISEGAVVGASSVVANYIPPFVVAVGVPAKKFTARFSEENLNEILNNVNSKYSKEEILNIYKKNKVTFKAVK